MNKILLSTLIFLGYSSLSAAQDILSVDRSVTSDVELTFENNDNIQPKRSDFEISNYVLMSSENGARWAVVTLKNTSSGTRIFNNEQVLALFANGDRFHPVEIKKSFDGLESISLTLSFGGHAFPILEIYTR